MRNVNLIGHVTTSVPIFFKKPFGLALNKTNKNKLVLQVLSAESLLRFS